MKKKVTIRINGLVQGVSFRYYSREKAGELGLTGYVRNTPNGGIEIVAEGEEEGIRKLLEWSGRGPLFAKVQEQTINWQNPTGEYPDFQII